MKLLKPTKINGMSQIYRKYPGPFAIDEGDLNKIFPGIHMVETIEYEEWTMGNLPEENLKFINTLVSYLKPKVIVEIGTFRGRTTYNMAKNSPESLIITIDAADGGNFYSGNDTKFFLPFEFIGSCYKVRPEQKRIIQRYGDSTSLGVGKSLDKILKDRKIDFAFIDGGHTYENIKHDFEELILPRLNKGGIAVFDDFNHLYAVIGPTHYLAEKAREDHYIFYWYAPRKSKNTNEVIFINLPEARNYDWEKS